MDFLTWGSNPWGQRILTHISWDLLWASMFAGIMFFVAHASYMILSAHRKRSAAETDALEAQYKNLPDKIVRHGGVARAFHWVMAASMFVLLFTAFLPIAGIRFAWVTWHWIAGLVLTASILFHIIHATFFLDFWSIWVGPKDIPEFKAEILRELGHDVPGPKPGKYPLGNRLYHLAIVFAGLAAVGTGHAFDPLRGADRGRHDPQAGGRSIRGSGREGRWIASWRRSDRPRPRPLGAGERRDRAGHPGRAQAVGLVSSAMEREAATR
jgi:hypothetical protein